ncbi:MAG TPA: ATP-binding protein [Oscillospiraceae bacterium]|jgi:AAA15 family ATPase/GTPase|nr:ATP-binding protein [Oscillospiraceae bacterium]
MLLFFGLENWMSYREPYGFSMMATPSETYSSHLAIIPGKRRVLPTSLLFGGNASGKSNFFDAIGYLRGSVLGHYLPEDSLPFLLDEKKRQSPTNFQIDFLYREKLLRYQLSIDRSRVLHEALYELDRDLSAETTVFQRQLDDLLHSDSLSEEAIAGAEEYLACDNSKRLLLRQLIAESDAAESAYMWFRESLSVQNSRFSEEARFDLIESLGEKPQLLDLINKLLPLLDNSIDHFELAANKDKQLFAVHRDTSGKEIRFPLQQESSGIRHLLDILPPLILSLDDEVSQAHVMVIDEWDRNLHSLLAQELLNFFLDQRRPDSRTQLIISSHDLNLLNREMFRSDELWITERLSDGSSTLIPLSDFKALQEDEVDYRQLYLEGRLGGIPNLNAFLLSDWPQDAEVENGH